jgi:uncharacterized protein (TIGR03382 family)
MAWRRATDRLSTVTRLIFLFTGLLAVSSVSAQVHVSPSATSPSFLASSGSPAIWLPEPDAGIPLSGARVFVPGNVAMGRGVPLAFALDGGSIPLTTINANLPTPRDPKADPSGWVPFTNMSVAYGLSVDGVPRNVVTPGAYLWFVYDGDARLDDVSTTDRAYRPGADDATTFGPDSYIYAAYARNLNIYRLITVNGGVGLDPTFTGGSEYGGQAVFPDDVTAVVDVPGWSENSLLVGTTGTDAGLGHAALLTVDRRLKAQAVVSVEDGGHLGRTMEGLAVYHARDRGDGGSADWALVTSDGRLLLYEVQPNFGFVNEIVIDGPNPSPYYQGIAVNNQNLGPYDQGLAVVFDSDDTSTGSGQLLFVRWDDIVNAVDAGLAIDTSFDVQAYLAGSLVGTGPTVDGGHGQPTLGGGIGDPKAFSSGSCGGGAGPMFPVAGAIVLLGGFARRRRH